MSATAATELPYFDIADESFAMQSEEVRAARDASWIARTNYGYAVLRYEEVSELLKSPKLSQGSAKWPEHHGVHSGIFYDWWSKNLLVLEGDEHHRIRRLLNPAFSPSMARKLEPQFKELAEELIAGVVDKGEMEFVHDFAEPFATRALCIMMGLDHKHWQFIADRANTVGYALSVTIKEDIDRVDVAVKELYDFVEELIQERQANPGQDVVSRLVQFSEGGDKLTGEELRNALVLMLFGGMDTTRNQLGLMVQTFIHNPDQWEKLAANPELTSAALEEVLRVNPTTRWVTREAIEDFEYKGVEIKAGTTVHLFTHASGTDPEAYPNPEIDIEATDRKPHFTFGGGMHHCLGHYIARADMSQALPVLAANITNISSAGGDEWLPDSGNTGPVKFPITFDKRA
ncbi:cytochrome P450 [Gulosibacter molinativorax]|uniref:Cytochrome P450 n=1 Tax=Gulosibacter molinativorax TaxID=256821 RepID=A0ABT7C4E5_9MICO|nr:cytochrome P450 [Gulosibacter molinativorax]MDJ1370083.1 cytochrome P450 [Gulosibacter molinativorax]QUY63724.1 Cytochrome P450 [Gulosibacter molinativorax]